MFMSTWIPMPQTQSFPHPHEMVATDRMASSLVITSQQSQTLSPQSKPGRPKLSLNTAQTRTFGKGSSLRLETLSAISPTIINTFSNAYEPPAAQPPASSSEQKKRPKLSINSSIQYQAPEDPTAESQDSRTPSSASVSSASTANSATFPYSNSQILNSILVNSPIPRLELPRKMVAKPRFPAEKKVSFRTPLEEEIFTTIFPYAHYDAESPDSASTASLTTSTSPEDSVSDTASLSPSGSSDSLSSISHSSQRTEGSYLKQRSMNSLSISSDSSSPLRSPSSPAKRHLPHRGRNRPKIKSPRSPQTGEKRDSSSESDSDTYPETPVAGRRKLNRDWVWTLGTLPGQSPQNSTDGSTTSTPSSSASFSSSIASRSDESS
ncbi:hypothetical protein E2P81_ATG02705 [Venturia nashicola]|nr:hypothetical protein E2P81_ATG02705 [Venturia nashicola]